MEVIILDNAEAVAVRAAKICCETIRRQPATNLGLATGSTPVALYKKMIAANQKGEVSFSEVKTFNLDEYVGLDPEHPQSYRHFMNEQLFAHIDIPAGNTHVPAGNLPNPMDSGPQYEKTISESSGIDLQILGIGTNGHIGFNEPTSSLASRTRVKTLTESTVRDNSRFFGPGEFQPTLAITMGIGTIMDSRRVLLLATGKNKAAAIAQAIEGPVSSICPASALQFHNNTTFIIDRDAAADLKMTEYYSYVLKHQDSLTDKFGDPRG